MDPMDLKSIIGPLVDKKKFERVMGFIEKVKTEAELTIGGERMAEKESFVQPTLFLKPGIETTIYRGRIFGALMINQYV